MIESSEEFFRTVAARIIEIETGVDWYYVVCTKCASTLTVVEGKLVCRRCKIKCNAIPRLKVQVVVMDESGSTTFVLFDQIIPEHLGRNVWEYRFWWARKGKDEST